MSNDVIRRIFKEIETISVGAPPYLKDVMLGQLQAAERQLSELETASTLGQAYQWAFENGIVSIGPASLIKKFVEAQDEQ